MFRNIKEKIWDTFLLDFYTDKRFSWKFKIINFITKDNLRMYLVEIDYRLRNISNENEEHNNLAIQWYTDRATKMLNKIWKI